MIRVASCVAAILVAASPASADSLDTLISGGKAGLDLRYRFEQVDQDPMAQDANANTLRLRLNLATGTVNGFSGFAEFDHLQVIGSEDYNSTRNGRTAYPTVADPEGTDLNQAYVQFKNDTTQVRLGRQRIRMDGERFIGAVGWRQNEQTYDAFLVESSALTGAKITYGFIDTVRRVFGPDSGNPSATFDSNSHFINVQLTKLPVGTLTFYDYYLDFDNAANLSSNTWGLRYNGSHKLAEKTSLNWGLEYAQQQDAADSVANVDADYTQIELGLKHGAFGVVIGRETLSGESGTFAVNPAFQTPLATGHKWQGWADKFLTTPSGGIEDIYVGVSGSLGGFNAQAVWHDFTAEATSQDYGSELNLSISRKFAKRYEVLLKFADYSADGMFTDTQKFWLQLGASF